MRIASRRAALVTLSRRWLWGYLLGVQASGNTEQAGVAGEMRTRQAAMVGQVRFSSSEVAFFSALSSSVAIMV